MLYTLFTYDWVTSQTNSSIIHLTDDTTVIVLITDGEETENTREVAGVVSGK